MCLLVEQAQAVRAHSVELCALARDARYRAELIVKHSKLNVDGEELGIDDRDSALDNT